MEKSPRWKDAMQRGQKVVLIMYACNAGSTEFLYNGELLPNLEPIAMKMSKSKLFKNVTILAADGYAIFGNPNGKSEFLGIGNHRGDGGFIKFENGKMTSKQQRAYISPGVTKNLPKDKIE